MSEPTFPAAETPKRRRASEEESSGGKALLITLLVIALGLGFAWFKRHSGANAQADKDAAAISLLTSNVAELKTKLVLEQGNTSVAQTNQQAALDRRTAELMTVSNRVVQTSLRLEDARQEARAVQAELPAKAVAIAILEAQRDELQRQAALVPALQDESAAWKKKLGETQLELAALHEQLGRARLERADLERKLEDPLFLRTQERRVMEAVEARQRAAAGQRIDASDKRVRLELQPDGTVRPVFAADATGKK